METVAFVLFNLVIAALFAWAWSSERREGDLERKREIAEQAARRRKQHAGRWEQ